MPCFDEPIFKAIFKVHLKVREPEHIALSNTQVEKIEEAEDGNWYTF
jgi:aminopeptidase N